jgi:hypothetical protein
MESTYRVARMMRVVEQIRDLAARATSLGIKAELIAALESIDEQLQTAPLTLGNPLHNTKKQGGVVCVGIVEPISVRFAVFEREKAVFLLDVQPLTRFFPE